MKEIRKVTVHGGHNPSGKVACGASDFLDESTEDRIITKKVIRLLRKNGIKAVNCTVNNGTSQTDVLRKICAKCNRANADMDISIHFNDSASEKKRDGQTTGTEVFVINNTGDRADVARRICHQMEKIGFTNRGVKVNKNLYFLRNTIAPAVLVEVCFVDDWDDARLYINDKDAVAMAIVRAILFHNRSC